MSKTPVEFKGELRWVVVPPFSNARPIMEPKAGQENNTQYSLEVECTRNKYMDLLDLGMPATHKLHKDAETGKSFLRLKAPKINGRSTRPDPSVSLENGDPVPGMIANGSQGIVQCTLDKFKSNTGKDVTALRFHTVTITKYVEYVRPEEAVQNNDDAHASDSQEENW